MNVQELVGWSGIAAEESAGIESWWRWRWRWGVNCLPTLYCQITVPKFPISRSELIAAGHSHVANKSKIVEDVGFRRRDPRCH